MVDMEFGSRVIERGPKGRTGRITGVTPSGHMRVQFDTGQYRIMAPWRLDEIGMPPAKRALEIFDYACRDLVAMREWDIAIIANWNHAATEADRLAGLYETRQVFIRYFSSN